jgi:hypothetical protein
VLQNDLRSHLLENFSMTISTTSKDPRAYANVLEVGRQAGEWLLAHPSEDIPEEVWGQIKAARQYLKPILLRCGNREIAKVIRRALIKAKRDYDLSGPESKTPYALRSFQEGTLDREVVVCNVSGFATTHGCSGGCKMCGADAYPARLSDVEVVPLEQKKHFLKEYSESTRAAMMGKYIHSKILLYDDSDPFNDPDLFEVLEHLCSLGEKALGVSTSVPNGTSEYLEKFSVMMKRYHELTWVRLAVKSVAEGREPFMLKWLSGAVYEEILEEWGQGGVTLEVRNKLEQRLADLEDGARLDLELQIRISERRRNSELAAQFLDRKIPGLKVVEKESGSDEAFRPLGMHFQEGYEGNRGLGLWHGMVLTPFDLSCEVSGNANIDFPQGRLLVPFRGFCKEGNLAVEGKPLSLVLQNLVVMNSRVYGYRSKGELNPELFAYDGLGRVRLIKFDVENYTVISDQILLESSESVRQINRVTINWFWGNVGKAMHARKKV